MASGENLSFTVGEGKFDDFDFFLVSKNQIVYINIHREVGISFDVLPLK